MDSRIEDYLAYLGAVRGLSERTVRSYREDFLRFEAFLKEGGIEGPDAAAPRDIRAFAAELVAGIEDGRIGGVLIAAADRDGGRIIGDEEAQLLDQIVAEEARLGDGRRIDAGALEFGESARQ